MGAVSRATNRPRAFPRFFHFPQESTNATSPNDARHHASRIDRHFRAGRRDIGQSLSNVVFQGTVLRVREVPGDAATRYTYDVRVQIGSTEATRVTIAGARASESQPGGLELSTPEFHPGDQVSCYRVSRSEWIVTGREPQNKENQAVSLALETERAVLSMDPAGYILAGSVRRGASGVASDSAILSMASGIYSIAGVDAALMRLSERGLVVDHVAGESSRLSWSDGVLALASSGANHERDRLSIPLLIDDSDAKPQIRRFSSGGAAATTDAEGITGQTAAEGNPSHTHDVGSLAVVVNINGYFGHLGSISLSNHMVETQSDLAPQQTVSDPVEIRSARGARWQFVGREANLSWEREPSADPAVALVALLGGGINRGESVLTATKALLTQYLGRGFRTIPSMEPTTDNAFPDLSDPERRRRMEDIGGAAHPGRPCDLQRHIASFPPASGPHWASSTGRRMRRCSPRTCRH